MDIIREFTIAPEKRFNYWCSWRTQNTVCKNKTLKKVVANGSTRDAMSEEFLFGEIGVLEKTPREIRDDLIALLDDGWDVPYGAEPKNISQFGSFELNEERFPSFKGSPAERLKEMSDRVKALGWHGLGLWIAVQMHTGDGRKYSLDEAREYLRERLGWCAFADVKYLKLDWGINGNDVEFRTMINDEAKKIAPGMVIEQANLRNFLDVRYSDRHGENYESMKKRIAGCLMNGDSFRVYDATPQFRHTTLIARTAEAFGIIAPDADRCGSVINVEDGVYIGASLGCSIGAMRCYPCETDPANNYSSVIETPTNTLARALRFQRVAPPFAVNESEYLVSDEIVHDSYKYPKTDKRVWPGLSEQLIAQDCNQAVSRGLPLPTAENCESGEKPIVLCAKNPRSGVSSVFVSPRTIGGSCFHSVLADITLRGCDADKPVGIFGHYKSLTVVFDTDMTGRRVYGQDLLSDEAVDITDGVRIDGRRLVIDGEIIERIGLSLRECETELPGMLILAR